MKVLTKESVQNGANVFTKFLGSLFFYSTYLLASLINFSFFAYAIFDDKMTKNNFWENGGILLFFLIIFFYFFHSFRLFFGFGKKVTEALHKTLSKKDIAKLQFGLDIYVLLSFLGYLYLVLAHYFVASPWVENVVSTLETGTYDMAVVTLSFLLSIVLSVLFFTFLVSHFKENIFTGLGALLLAYMFFVFTSGALATLLGSYTSLQAVFGVSVAYLYFNYTKQRILQVRERASSAHAL